MSLFWMARVAFVTVGVEHVTTAAVFSVLLALFCLPLATRTQGVDWSVYTESLLCRSYLLVADTLHVHTLQSFCIHGEVSSTESCRQSSNRWDGPIHRHN